MTTVWEPKQTMREEEIVYIYFVLVAQELDMIAEMMDVE